MLCYLFKYNIIIGKMNNKMGYSPQYLKNTIKTEGNYNKSPIKLHPNKVIHTSNSYFDNHYLQMQTQNQFKNVKRVTDQIADLRHTMNYKMLSKLSNQNNEIQQQKNAKFNDFFRQTLNYKNPKTAENFKNIKDSINSQQAYLKNETTEQSNRYLRKQQRNKPSQAKSVTNLLESSRSIREYEILSQKIERNKKMIDQLRKNKESQKESNYLKNVAVKKVPNFIQFQYKQPQKNEYKDFRKRRANQYQYFTPKVDKNTYQSRFNSSPLIPSQEHEPYVSYKTIDLTKSTAHSSKITQFNYDPIVNTPQTKNLLNVNTLQIKRKTSINSINSIKIPSKNLQNSLSQYQIGKKLGQGKFGIVNMVRHKKTNGIFAMKKILKSVIKSNMMMDQLALQIRLQSCIRHVNVLTMHGFFDDKTHLYILLEYMDGGTLYHKLKRQTKLCQKQTAYIIKQMTSAIQCLHDLGIAHRDIKPQNIVQSSNIYKLCDFGWAALCNQRRKTYCGTFDYVAPEILQGVDYDMTVDLWCLGVMTYQLLTGKAPFYHISRKQTMKKILNVDTIEYPNDMSQMAKDFIDKLIRKNPKQRITAQDALLHPFIKNAQWD